MRRFTFKLRFDYLDLPRVKAAFQCFFATTWPTQIPPPNHLTPGDYAVVQQHARIEGTKDPVRLARMLVDECRHKGDSERGMGFL